MKWNIIADSSCDMFDNQLQDDSVRFCTIPFYINVGNVEFVDDEKLDHRRTRRSHGAFRRRQPDLLPIAIHLV